MKPPLMKPAASAWPSAVWAVITPHASRECLLAGPSDIPGVWVRADRRLSVPENAIGVVKGLLQNACTVWTPPSKWKPLTWDEIKSTVEPHMTETARVHLEGREFQRELVTLATNRNSLLLQGYPGIGKTLVGLTWALAAPGPCVYVTKASVVGHIKNQIALYTKATVKRLKGETPFDLGDCRAPFTFLLLSWAVLPYWIETLAAIKPVSWVADESENAKNSRRYERLPLTPQIVDEYKAGLRELTKTEKIGEDEEGPFLIRIRNNITGSAMRLARIAKRRLATSATPLADRPRDLYAQADLVDPGSFGKSWKRFGIRYCNLKAGAFGGLDDRGTSNAEELKARLSVLRIRRTYAECKIDLPPITRSVLYLDAEAQVKESAGFLKELKAASRLGPSFVFEARLMQAASRKRKWLVDFIQAEMTARKKLVVFTGRRKEVETLKGLAESAWPKWFASAAVEQRLSTGHLFSGHGGSGHVSEIAASFVQAPAPACLIGTGDAFGQGLDLTGTNTLVFGMLPWTPRGIVQQEGRVGGFRATSPVWYVYPICEGTVEEHVADILIAKLPVAGDLGGNEGLEELASDLKGMDEEKLAESMLTKFESPVT